MEFIISNLWIILFIGILLFIVLKYTKSNKKDFKELLNQGAIIIDVRTESEYKSGHLKNSINVPLKDLTYRINEFDKKDNIVTVCAAGMRAESAKKFFESRGFNVANGGRWSPDDRPCDSFHR